jgi:heme/copper-type cytochrome/quinol oxidase subunit 2
VKWPWRLFLVCLGLFVLTSRGHTGSVDEESLIYASARLVQDATKLLNFSLPIPMPARVGTQVFTSYEPGQPLVAIPFYLAGSLLAAFFPLESHTYVTRLVVTLFGALVTAVTVARLYQLGRVLGQSERGATFMAATFTVGTFAWPYARTFFREPLVALALVSAAYALVRWRERPSWRLALAGWGWVLLAVTTKLAALVVLPVFAAYFAGSYLARRRLHAKDPESKVRGATETPTRTGGWAVALVLAVAILAAGGLVLLSRWRDIGPYLERGGLLSGDLSYVPLAFYGLTLSPGKGLLIFAPPVLAGLAGFYLLYRQRRAEALVFAALAASFLVIYSFNTSWHGGATWGPRYLLPVLPFLILPVGTLAQALWSVRHRMRGQVGLALVGALVAAGVLVQVAAISVDPINYYMRAFERRPLTMDGGPAYLQEIHFDPAFSPVTGHLALAGEYAGNLLGGRNHFRQVPFGRDDYLQYFREARSLDFTIVHLYEWSRAPR